MLMVTSLSVDIGHTPTIGVIEYETESEGWKKARDKKVSEGREGKQGKNVTC